MSYLKAQGHKDFLLPPQSFIFLHLTCKSMINFFANFLNKIHEMC